MGFNPLPIISTDLSTNEGCTLDCGYIVKYGFNCSYVVNETTYKPFINKSVDIISKGLINGQI